MDTLGFFIASAGMVSIIVLFINAAHAWRNRYLSRAWGQALLLCLLTFLGTSVVGGVVQAHDDEAVPAARLSRNALEFDPSLDEDGDLSTVVVTDAMQSIPFDRPPEATELRVDITADPCINRRRLEKALRMFWTLTPSELGAASEDFERRLGRCRKKVRRKQAQRHAQAERRARVRRHHAPGTQIAALDPQLRFRGIERHLRRLRRR